MSARISRIFLCPRCSTPMSSQDKPVHCPKCKYRFNAQGDSLSTSLSWPKAPSRQLFEIIQQEVDKAIPKDGRDLIPNLSQEARAQIVIGTTAKQKIITAQWEQKRDEFFAATQSEDIEELIQCLHYLMSRCISSGNKDLILKCQIWSAKFAQINNYLEPFIENGGACYARTNKPAGSGDSSDNK